MNTNKYALPTRPHCTGFTLLEVLIAVLVLSIGLLGLAGLQATSMRNNHDAYLTTQATYLANDIADRIRANRSAGALTAYANGNTGLDGTCYTPGGCAPTAMAANDRSEWDANLLASLPAGLGSVARAGNLFTVTVMWDDRDPLTPGCAVSPAGFRCVTIVTEP